MTFGEKIKAARLALNLSQTELASVTGISERSIYTYETQNILPRKSNLKKLSLALHVSEEYLTDEYESGPQEAPEEEAFLQRVHSTYGNRGACEAREVLQKAGALFAGGELDAEAKDIFMQSLMQVYLSSKEKASEKFSPKKRKKRSLKNG